MTLVGFLMNTIQNSGSGKFASNVMDPKNDNA